MLFVLLANLLRFVVRLRVVVAIRQPEAALIRATDHLRAVLLILSRSEIEERADAQPLQPRNFRLQFPRAVDRLNPRKFRIERL